TADGEVKILDFGIARRTRPAEGAASTYTEDSAHAIAGTPQYMAPEAHLGGAVDARTDIFSLGAVFYELLTGIRPFAGPTYAAVVDRVLNDVPPPVVDLRPDAGIALSAMVGRMLDKDPARRFA